MHVNPLTALHSATATKPAATTPPVASKDSDGDSDHNAPDAKPASGTGTLVNLKA